jgi:hypothetical protein
MQERTIMSEKFIKNGDKKICKNCAYFIASDYENAPLLAKCSKFGTKNIVDGDINHYYADSCRYDENQCGSNARWYEDRKNDTGNSTKPDSSNEQMHKINGVIIE